MSGRPHSNQLVPTDVLTARRFMSTRSEAARRAPSTQGVNVTWAELVAKSGNRQVPVRLYRPIDVARPGVLILFHGGGFVAGDLDTDHELAVAYCSDARIAVLSVDYRLAPEHPFPAAFDDARLALTWLAQEATGFGLDPRRIAVGGTSAGGAIAASLAQWSTRYDGPQLCLQMLLVPTISRDRVAEQTYRSVDGGSAFDGPAAARMWLHYLGRAAIDAPPPLSMPGLSEDLEGLPAAYIVVAERDPLRSSAVDYAARLGAAGVAVDLHRYACTDHGFVANGDATFAGTRCLADRIAVLRRLLAGSSNGYPAS